MNTKTPVMKDVISVLDFGADPTGVVDSKAAISRAVEFAQASGKDVHFPTGTYRTMPTKLIINQLRAAGHIPPVPYSAVAIAVRMAYPRARRVSDARKLADAWLGALRVWRVGIAA